MVLFSTTYAIRLQVSKRALNGAKFLLFDANDIRLSDLPLPGQRRGLVFQVQRDEFHNLGTVKHGVGEKPFYEEAQAAKRDPRNQCQAHYDSAKNNRVEQKICQIVFLADVGI